MSHSEESDVQLSHEELQYLDHIRRASDFMKIDLFLSARREYEKALEYKPNDVFALDQIALCTGNIRRDTRKVLIIVPLVIAIIVIIALLF